MNRLVQFGTSEHRVHKSFGSVRVFRTQSAINFVQFGSSEHRARLIWFSSGLQSTERDSFGSVRDFRAQSVNHWFSRDFRAQSVINLVQFGTSERESFGSDRDFRAQSLIHLIQFRTSEHRAQIICFNSGLQSTERGSVRDFRKQSANH